jgi:hypothetical protein
MSLISVGLNLAKGIIPTAIADGVGSATGKALIAPLENKSESPAEMMRRSMIDEGPETAWKAILGRVCVEVSKSITPWVPEQIVIIPTQLVGSLIHWASSSHSSVNREAISGREKKEKGMVAWLHGHGIKKPIEYLTHLAGMDKESGEVNYWKFLLTQAGILGACGFALRNQEGENIPGINVSEDDSMSTTIFKTLGYTAVEQSTQLISQGMRYYIDYATDHPDQPAEFREHKMAKVVANVVNERSIPGNIPSSICECLSTLWLGKYLTKPVAASLVEIPTKAFERFATFKLRRSTKHTVDDEGNRIANYRTNDTIDNVLYGCDKVFGGIRTFIIDKVVARLFLPDGAKIDEFASELRASFNVNIENLKLSRDSKKDSETTTSKN